MSSTKVLLEIKDLVNKELNIDIAKGTREQEYIFARSVYYALCRKHTSSSLALIGSLLNKNHATVMNGLKTFRSLEFTPNSYKVFMDAYEKIDAKIAGMDLKDEESIVTRLIKEKNEIIQLMAQQNDRYNNLRHKHNTMLKYFKKYEKNVWDKYAEV
jgi:hypothetical protein